MKDAADLAAPDPENHGSADHGDSETALWRGLIVAPDGGTDMEGLNSLPISRAHGLEPCAACNASCIAKSVNYECAGDHNEQGGAATNDREREPSTAGGDHDPQYRHHHCPAHAARTLRGEIQRETPTKKP